MINLGTLNFNDPIIIPSGIIPDVKKVIQDICTKYKPSAITTKTLTKNPLSPHNPPTILKFHDNCYINAIGLGNPGMTFINDLHIGCKLFISIGGKSVQEIKEVAEFAQNKADLLEINISSPNRKGYGASLANDVYKIVKDVKGSVSKPVFVKLGPWDNILEIAGKALEAGADGLTLINTLKGLLIDVESLEPILTYETGGISGKCIYPLSLRIISEVYKEYEPSIIGVGGVFSYKEVIGLMSVGAKLVGIGTAIIDKGYDIINEIRRDLDLYLNQKGLKLEDIIGKAVKR
ncbi:dihydroorotate dehydrogenase PyrD [Acidianus brierleyi]|uniref:Dihydroorotate dehydrogenase n=1 Tax=Acidianus brierleyi TaxID=41673 RepID=A0A2U9IFF2_9CREN|nr:dihydroorotate dehydrogenase PyrD [Acidianus brierleyi]AWR94777.1 dihydroorotate dehydrogenase [Acidianus brierleyi]